MVQPRDVQEAAWRVQLGGDAHLYCALDDYTDAWRPADTVVLLHGIAEHGGIWRAWVPHLARRYRVLRPDLRGFGRSSALPAGGAFTLADWADDIERMIDSIGSGRGPDDAPPRVHLIGTKLGALVAFELAQRRRPWIASMTLAGMLPSPSKALGPWLDEWVGVIEREGVESWARLTMPGRMGKTLPPEALEWWARLMGTTSAATVLACMRLLPGIDEPPNPEGIACPTLFIVPGAHETGGTYNQRPAPADLLRLQSRVRGSTLREIPADSYHIAATHPDACAIMAAEFIEEC
ncbi:alpha/beta fold hydrolase [Caballeronia sp. dw_19]|uniref:alpha/beta fold hydrolase n=1 Tax=Caballeronia sp. dw_19 TaxID=2719791 RepID=UPI001BD5A808|nr:alpha/beta fold hydrolase [Caballeronia sp. dw_19]